MKISQLDSQDYQVLNFPYNKIAGPLSSIPRIVNGSNTSISLGGTLQKRPGTDFVTNSLITKKCYRLIVYETLEATPKVYLIGSFFNSGAGVYEAYYNRLDGGSPGWTIFPTYTGAGVNLSTTPHEFVVQKGLCWVRAVPNVPSGDLYGTSYFDGINLGLHPWGMPGPGLPIGLTNPAGWGASAHPVTVNYSWGYVFSYQSVTIGGSGNIGGNVSPRSPLQTNPDALPSFSGPFTNKIPEIKITTTAPFTDIVQYPKINIYRTTDGGGNFFFLKAINNTGAATITTLDDALASGAGNQDPLPDAQLDTTREAPSTTSNAPPPSVIPPLVTGSNTPQQGTGIVSFSGRLWYAIQNYLYYSALEEIPDGIPEECWPTGLLGNFFRLPAKVIQLLPTTQGMYIVMNKQTYIIQGSTKDTFVPRLVFADIGAPQYASTDNKAGTVFNDSATWLTQDYRVVVVNGTVPAFISDPLFDDILNAKNATSSSNGFSIAHWAYLERDYLVISALDFTPGLAKQWVYDIKKAQVLSQDFWFTPWNITSSIAISGRLREAVVTNSLIFINWTGSNSIVVTLNTNDTAFTDWFGNTGTPNVATAVPFGAYCDFHQMTIPPGNHVNALSKPAKVPVVEYLELVRAFPSDFDPKVYFFLDDLYTDAQASKDPEKPNRRKNNKGFRTIRYNIKKAVARFSWRLEVQISPVPFKLYSFYLSFNPVQGL